MGQPQDIHTRAFTTNSCNNMLLPFPTPLLFLSLTPLSCRFVALLPKTVAFLSVWLFMPGVKEWVKEAHF